MLAIVGALSLAAAAALLRYAMISNQRRNSPAWTASWIVNGVMAPAVITLGAVGLVLLIRFGLDFQPSGVGFMEIAVSALILAGGVVLWRRWTPKAHAAAAARADVVRAAPGHAGGPLPPKSGASAGSRRRRKKAA